jgi:hypothetical protein
MTGKLPRSDPFDLPSPAFASTEHDMADQQADELISEPEMKEAIFRSGYLMEMRVWELLRNR